MFSFKNVVSIMISSLLILGCDQKQETGNGDGMILASFEKYSDYIDAHPGFAAAFEFLQRSDLPELESGRYDLAGDSVFCMISKGPGKAREEARLEAHRKYIDIQYVIAGDEEMGWRPVAECNDIETPYSEEKDIMFFNDPAKTWTTVPPGSFVIFYPEDAHAPMVGDGEIHKVVCKVLK